MIPTHALTLWTQVAMGPVDVAEFDSGADVKCLKELGLVKMINHTRKPRPAMLLELTEVGKTYLRLLMSQMVANELYEWMDKEGIRDHLKVIKLLKDKDLIAVEKGAKGLQYRVI